MVDTFLSHAIDQPRIHDFSDPRDLFDLAELGKARLLLDSVKVPPITLPSTDDGLHIMATESHILEFKPLGRELKTKPLLRELPYVSRLPIDFLVTEEKSQKGKQIDEVEASYEAMGVGYIACGKTVRAEEVMSQLEDDELLIEYFLPYKDLEPAYSIYIIALSKDKARTVTIRSAEPLGQRQRIAIDGSYPLDFSDYTQTVANFRIAIQQMDIEGTQRYGRVLYDWLIAPVVNMGFSPGQYSKWILVPHGMFHPLPFGALIDPDGKYLIESVAISTMPSASLWSTIISRLSAPVTSLLAIEDPDHGDPELEVLEEASREVSRVLAAAKKHNLTTTHLRCCDATETAVREALSGKGIVHITAHGEFSDLNPLDLHRIRLAPDHQYDGHLQANEICKIDLKATRLLILSICDGSIYRFGPGDEPYGLLAAAFTAGVENVLGVLWAMHDDLGVEFIIEFYKHLATNEVAGALRRTCLSFIREDSPPYYWSGFALMGPGRAIC